MREYALARTERKSGQGYTGFTCYAAPDVTLEEDLLRRDLTINAIARSAEGELIDPYGGVADLQARVLRHVSDAFGEDPLRVLRVARFAARFAHLGFHIADETLALMRQMAHGGELAALTAERVWKGNRKGAAKPEPAGLFSGVARLRCAGGAVPGNRRAVRRTGPPPSGTRRSTPACTR